MTSPLHHIYQRKMAEQKLLSPYPHQHGVKRVLDLIIYPVGIIGPLLMLPQVIKIWTTKDATGVSAFTFFGLMLLAVIWILYGALHRDKPILITNIGFAVFQLLVALGALIYG